MAKYLIPSNTRAVLTCRFKSLAGPTNTSSAGRTPDDLEEYSCTIIVVMVILLVFFIIFVLLMDLKECCYNITMCSMSLLPLLL